mgnify:FL=1
MDTLGTINKQINPLTTFKNIELYPRTKTNSKNYVNNKKIEFDLNYSNRGVTHTLTIRIDKNCFNKSEFNCSLSESCNNLENYKALNFLLQNNQSILCQLENYMDLLTELNKTSSLI